MPQTASIASNLNQPANALEDSKILTTVQFLYNMEYNSVPHSYIGQKSNGQMCRFLLNYQYQFRCVINQNGVTQWKYWKWPQHVQEINQCATWYEKGHVNVNLEVFIFLFGENSLGYLLWIITIIFLQAFTHFTSQLNVIFFLLKTTLNYYTVYFTPSKLRSHECKQMITSLNESQSRRRMETMFAEKPEARCDSEIDSHRRCSRATWVGLWNVVPLPAGVLWALRHSPVECLSTPQERAESPLPGAWI